MERIAEALADLTDDELDRVAAFIDALTEGMPGGLNAWSRHVVDQERDDRAGNRYRLREPMEAIESDELEYCIVVAMRLRNGSIDPAVGHLFNALVGVLEDARATGQDPRTEPGSRP